MASRRGWWLPVAVVLTAAGCTLVIVVTGFVACGVSGCGGGGYGPVFAPRQAQLGLLVAGITMVPLALLLVGRRSVAYRAVGVVGAVAVGSALAMVVLGLGPNGCPWGQSQAITGTGGFSPGALTCSSDRNAVPARQR